MKEIILELKYDEQGKYLGKVVCYEEDLTPELFQQTKNHPLWNQHRKILREKGYEVHGDDVE